jgi:hypothetical protein
MLAESYKFEITQLSKKNLEKIQKSESTDNAPNKIKEIQESYEI